MTLQIACVRVELGLLGPPGSQEHVFLGPLAHARGLPSHPPPPGGSFPAWQEPNYNAWFGRGSWGPSQHTSLPSCLFSPLHLLPLGSRGHKRGTCPSHFSVRSNKSPTVEIRVIALSGLGAIRLCEIPAQGRPQSHRHRSSHSVFLTVQGDTEIRPGFLDKG